MHACVVLQHYLVAMNNSDPIPMLNVAEYLKKFMSADRLYDHIWKDEGGDSFHFLKSILKTRPRPGTTNTLVDRTLVTADLVSLMLKYGPALVSGFAVSQDFTSSAWQHLGENDQQPIGYHAMVLVGYRTVGWEKRFLLQNWWGEKPYVEVDLQYLVSSEASVRFITEKQL